jgi:signal peptidase I
MTDQIPSTLPKLAKPSGIPNGLILTTAIGMVLAFVIGRAFLFQSYFLPSESMRPTINEGDFLWATKWNYGFSNLSLPLQPNLFKGRIFEQPPKRGDLIVFKLPRDNKTDYIKRLIGMPGDRIQMVAGRLLINDVPVKTQMLEPETITDESGSKVTVKRVRETLPEGASYITYDLMDSGLFDDTAVYVVPEGHYFMMGDNRDNSSDSRLDPVTQGGVGYVPAINLIGRVYPPKPKPAT